MMRCVHSCSGVSEVLILEPVGSSEGCIKGERVRSWVVRAPKPWSLLLRGSSCHHSPVRRCQGSMGCAPQLAHRSILLGEKHQEERLFFQTELIGVVVKDVDRSAAAALKDNHPVVVKRSYRPCLWATW